MLPATPDDDRRRSSPLAEAAPDELSTIANVMPCPPMPFVPEAASRQARRVRADGLRRRGRRRRARRSRRSARWRRRSSTWSSRCPTRRCTRPRTRRTARSPSPRTMFVDRVDAAWRRRSSSSSQASDAPMRVAQLRVLGGAMARVPADATAFAHRDRAGSWSTSRRSTTARTTATDARAWVEGSRRRRCDQGDDGAYVNFLADEGADRDPRGLPGCDVGPAGRRSRRRYDPTNLFRLNQNIPPAFDGTSEVDA